jgi:hypothetical protein
VENLGRAAEAIGDEGELRGNLLVVPAERLFGLTLVFEDGGGGSC